MQRESAVRRHLKDAVLRIEHQLRCVATQMRTLDNSEECAKLRVHAEGVVVKLESDRKEITDFLARTEGK